MLPIEIHRLSQLLLRAHTSLLQKHITQKFFCKV